MRIPDNYDRAANYQTLREYYIENLVSKLETFWKPKDTGRYLMYISGVEDPDWNPRRGDLIDYTHFDNADDLTIIHKFFQGFTYVITDTVTGEEFSEGLINCFALNAIFDDMEYYTGEKWALNEELFNCSLDELIYPSEPGHLNLNELIDTAKAKGAENPAKIKVPEKERE